MIDNYLLEELVTFAKTGTLAKTALELNVSQPSITRGMQKLEAELGVALFERQPNRITLTTTGQLAAEEAAKLLQAETAMIQKIRNFATNQQTLQIGLVIPGPRVLLTNLLAATADQVNIAAELLPDDQITALLTDARFSLILSNHNIQNETIKSQYLGTEKLAVNLPPDSAQAQRSTVRFQELAQLSFVVLADIGIWRTIIAREIPGAKFLYQAQPDAFSEITAHSQFPYFTTNLAAATPDQQRVRVPISDASAQMKVYANYLASDQQRLTAITHALIKAWPT